MVQSLGQGTTWDIEMFKIWPASSKEHRNANTERQVSASARHRSPIH